MAHFRATVQGNRGMASRLGTKSSGITTETQSWEGAVRVHLHEQDGVDMAYIELTPHHGSGTNKVLYNGPVSGEVSEDEKNRD